MLDIKVTDNLVITLYFWPFSQINSRKWGLRAWDIVSVKGLSFGLDFCKKYLQKLDVNCYNEIPTHFNLKL